MQLHAEQLTLLCEAAREKFVRRVIDFVRHHCAGPDAFRPELVPADDTELATAVRERLERARGHGLSSERGLATFVALSFSYAPEFDSLPLARAMLADESEPPEARIDRILDTVIAAQLRQRRAEVAA